MDTRCKDSSRFGGLVRKMKGKYFPMPLRAWNNVRARIQSIGGRASHPRKEFGGRKFSEPI